MAVSFLLFVLFCFVLFCFCFVDERDLGCEGDTQ